MLERIPAGRAWRPRRLAGALVCGPLGHLAAGVADWAALLASLGRARAGRRWV